MRKLTACLFLLTFFVTFSSINAQFEDLLKLSLKAGQALSVLKRPPRD